MTIFCKIGLPGFIVSLAIAGAPLVATFISIAIIDKVGNEVMYYNTCCLLRQQQNIVTL